LSAAKPFPQNWKKKPFKLLLLLLLLLPPTSLKTNPILLSCFQHKTFLLSLQNLCSTKKIKIATNLQNACRGETYKQKTKKNQTKQQ